MPVVENDPDTGDDPETGAVRFGEDDEVEVFDGQQWRCYRDLPPEDLYTLFRNDPETRDVKPEA
jgi:hypothetical protein